MDRSDWSRELLAGGTALWRSPRHPFGTDAFLLAAFAQPHKRDTACDLGAGCGIVSALLLERDTPPSRVTAVELLPEGVALMEATVLENHLEDRLFPLCADLRELEGILPAGTFDLVACNPPYFSSGTGKTAPHPARLSARHEGDASCTLEEVCTAANRLLKYGGRACFCHRPERLTDLLETMRRHTLEPKRLRMVQQRSDKAPWLLLVEGKKGGAPSLKLEAPLIIDN